MPPAKPPSPPRDPAPLSSSHTHTAAAPNMAAAAGLRPFPPPSGNIRAARQRQFPPVPETPAPLQPAAASRKSSTRPPSPSPAPASFRKEPKRRAQPLARSVISASFRRNPKFNFRAANGRFRTIVREYPRAEDRQFPENSPPPLMHPTAISGNQRK
ncbi:hypothetical protein KIL84_003204 [Mauremys mutica]|uniref:Uncharacterized protein n=1 Tax=Mauremys mutica TaxID=74926 RepID=A0A9D3WTN3_9SAUR|nr:hypothetical protein KIL84_003204 [Mauremys mutica]